MRILLLFIFTLLGSALFAQSPALIPYQAVARDASGQALNSATINTRFTIHDGTATGSSVWQELQTVTTSALGLFTAQLGSSVSLSGVNWANGNKFMQVEIDLGQGFVDMGTQQLLSVPFALHAGSAPDEQQLSVSETGDTLFLENGGFVVIPGISAANSSGSGGTTTGTNLHTCDACADCGTFTYCYDVFDFYQTTFCPDNANDDFLSITFLSGTVAVNDNLFVYNGPNAWPSSQIGMYTGDLTGQTWTSTDSSGCLTFSISEWDGVGNCTDGGAEEWTYSVTAGSTVNVHNPDLTYGSMTDQEDNVYKTIVIGTQEWMAENLNTSVYRNGDAIVTDLDNSAWGATTSGAWSYYNNDASYACPYGKLYNWFACTDPRGLCPTGWHVPSDSEWTSLTNFLGGLSVAGGPLKSTGTAIDSNGLWTSLNVGATNSSGFSGPPCGYRNGTGNFGAMGVQSYLWCSTQSVAIGGWVRVLFDNNGTVARSNNYKVGGYSVRCVRD